jgi:hypothetical protein
MELVDVDLDLGDDLRLRALARADAALVAEGCFMRDGPGRAMSAAAAARLPCVPGRLGYSRLGVRLDALVAAGKGDPRRNPMTDPGTPRHVEIKDGDQTVAAAKVTTSPEAGGTAQASLHAAPGHIAPGSRASLVDAVMDLPEVQASEHLQATVPLGDGESLERLRQRTEDTTTRPAGSTALLDANIPSDGEPGSGQEPGETSSS